MNHQDHTKSIMSDRFDTNHSHVKVCEAYKKIAASRSKKKSPSKKEKEVGNFV